MLTQFGGSYFHAAPGVYSRAAGNYTSCAMRDPNSYGTGCSNWRVGDGGRWWLRDTSHGEPNGDYTPGCWLGLGAWQGINNLNAAGFAFNDGGCGYATTKYVCSTNDKQ